MSFSSKYLMWRGKSGSLGLCRNAITKDGEKIIKWTISWNNFKFYDYLQDYFIGFWTMWIVKLNYYNILNLKTLTKSLWIPIFLFLHSKAWSYCSLNLFWLFSMHIMTRLVSTDKNVCHTYFSFEQTHLLEQF